MVFWIFLLFVVFRYLQGGHRIPALGAIRFEAITGSVLLLASIFLFLRLPTPTWPKGVHPPRIAPWITALFLVMILQVALSYDLTTSWTMFVDRVFKFALFGVMIFCFVTSPNAVRYFIATYLISFGKMTQEAIAGYVTGSMVWENQGVPRLHGSTPSYHHPNSLGGTQLSTLPFVASLWPVVPRWARIGLGVLGAGAVLVSIFTGSRTTYVALAAWIAYLIYRSESKFRAIVVVVVMGALATAFIPADYWARFSTIFTQQEIEGASMDLRKEIFSDAIDVFFQNPMGVGVGAFPFVRAERFGRSQDTHSLYLEIATNLGVPGLIAFAGLILALFRALAFVRNRIDENIDQLSQAYGSHLAEDSIVQRHLADIMFIRQVALAMTGFLIVRLSLGLFGHDLYEIYWWFLTGLTAALVRIQSVAERKTDYLLRESLRKV